MSTIDEIKKEIIERHQAAGPQPDTPAEAPELPNEKQKPVKREKTKAEIEAYKQKMMEKEEARYLGKQPKAKKAEQKPNPNPHKPQKIQKSKKSKKKSKTPRVQGAQKEQKVQKVQKVQKAQKAPKMPKILKPLVPLYLLHIPGLPKGDCIAICYAEGADA